MSLVCFVADVKIPVWLGSQKNIKLPAGAAFVSAPTFASTTATDSLQKRPTYHFLSSSSA